MKQHEEWLFKAEHDLESAKVLFHTEKELLDISVYHTQQCAEKSFKAYLSFRQQEIEKEHNLTLLMKKCSKLDSGFLELLDESLYLNPFSTLYRYPAGELMPARQEVKKAIDTARKILDFVIYKIQ